MFDKKNFTIDFILVALLINIGKFTVQFTHIQGLIFILDQLFIICVSGSVTICIVSMIIYFKGAWGQWEKNNMKWYSVTSIVVLVICIVEKLIEFVII